MVDDDPAVRDVLISFLTADGHTAVAAAGGDEALEALRAASYDVTLVDRAMPGMSGIELAAAIKRHTPSQRIIMVSGFGDIMSATGEQAPAVDLLLTKPIRREDLARALTTVMAH